MFVRGFLVALVVLCGIGYGLVVYPVHPWLVWVLLGVCWLCYRLRLRAVALFGKSQPPMEGKVERRSTEKLLP